MERQDAGRLRAELLQVGADGSRGLGHPGSCLFDGQGQVADGGCHLIGVLHGEAGHAAPQVLDGLLAQEDIDG